MACLTCDHTMQRVNSGAPTVFWCPRCGTLKMDGEYEEPWIILRQMVHLPKLLPTLIGALGLESIYETIQRHAKAIPNRGPAAKED